MNILAFYPSYKLSNHDACVSIVQKGELIYTYEEQKLSRVNHRESKYFPDRSILSALYTTKISPREIDLICLCGPNHLEDQNEVFKRLEKYFGITCKKVVVCPHHEAHTALSVLSSTFNRCIYWTLDAGGEDNIYGEFGVFNNGIFDRLYTLEKPSLATFYYLLTGCCGFTDFEEGKVMGLAGYGRVDKKLYDDMSSLFEFDDFGHALFQGESVYKYPKIKWEKFSHDGFKPYKVVQYLTKDICPTLEVITRGYLPETIAATGQKLVEDLAHESIARMVHNNSIDFKSLALGGGFFQNIIVNKVIRTSLKYDVFIPPGAGDMGLAAGAAMWASYKYDKTHFQEKAKHAEPLSPYLGPVFPNEEIENLLNSFSLEYENLSDSELAKTVAKQIADGKVVGWFQGRGEFGARALGKRSVLADPRNPDSKARVNQLLKKRDWFMPYAPSILAEYTDEFLQAPVYNPYMTMGFDATDCSLKKIPAAVHVDGTIRPQIVKQEDNPLYYKLISEFYKITGIPLILNTSFNRHGVPIVATPRQAIEHLMEGVVNVLCVGSFFVVRAYKRKEISTEQLVSEKKLKALLGIRHGYSFLEEGDINSANAIFRQTGYKIHYVFNDVVKDLTINGCKFDMTVISWREIADLLAKDHV